MNDKQKKQYYEGLKKIGYFREMRLYYDSGSVKDFIIDRVSYDKNKVIKYLSSFKRTAICPRYAIDCLTGKSINSSFSTFNDGEFAWCDFLVYHIQKYNIKLPNEFIDKIGARIDDRKLTGTHIVPRKGN